MPVAIVVPAEHVAVAVHEKAAALQLAIFISENAIPL